MPLILEKQNEIRKIRKEKTNFYAAEIIIKKKEKTQRIQQQQKLN